MYHDMRNTLEQIYQLTFYPFCFKYLYICLCFLCIVICMQSFHSAHIFIVYNSLICTKSFNILFYTGHIVLNYTAHFVYSPLNSYWIFDFKYILLLCKNCFMTIYIRNHVVSNSHINTLINDSTSKLNLK